MVQEIDDSKWCTFAATRKDIHMEEPMSDTSSPRTVDERLELDQMTRSEFVNALVHLYRGELGEATAWRGRIDTTSHWAIVLSASALSFVFSDNSSVRHVLIPIITLFCTFLLTMEARRYRFFDIWRSRARMIEINFYQPLLSGTKPRMADWAGRLAQDMEWPRFHMPWWEAMGRRLRRNYMGIYAVLLGSWFVVLMTHPTSTTSLSEIIVRAAVGPLPGIAVFIGMMLFYSGLAALGIYSYRASHRVKRLPAGHPERMSHTHREEA
jgi:uncharacterized membrane protein